MAHDLNQFFRNLLVKHHVVPGGARGGPLTEIEFEALVEALVEYAKQI